MYKVSEALKQVPIKRDSKDELSNSDDHTREKLLSQIRMTSKKLLKTTAVVIDKGKVWYRR